MESVDVWPERGGDNSRHTPLPHGHLDTDSGEGPQLHSSARRGPKSPTPRNSVSIVLCPMRVIPVSPPLVTPVNEDRLKSEGHIKLYHRRRDPDSLPGPLLITLWPRLKGTAERPGAQRSPYLGGGVRRPGCEMALSPGSGPA